MFLNLTNGQPHPYGPLTRPPAHPNPLSFQLVDNTPSTWLAASITVTCLHPTSGAPTPVVFAVSNGHVFYGGMWYSQVTFTPTRTGTLVPAADLFTLDNRRAPHLYEVGRVYRLFQGIDDGTGVISHYGRDVEFNVRVTSIMPGTQADDPDRMLIAWGNADDGDEYEVAVPITSPFLRAEDYEVAIGDDDGNGNDYLVALPDDPRCKVPIPVHNTDTWAYIAIAHQHGVVFNSAPYGDPAVAIRSLGGAVNAAASYVKVTAKPDGSIVIEPNTL